MLKNSTIEEEQFEDDPYTGMYHAPIGEINLNTDSSFIELNVLQDVYKSTEIEKDGEKVEDYILIKKDAKSKQTIWKDEVSHIKQVLNERGNNRTKRVELGMKYKDAIIVEGNYKKLRDIFFLAPKQQSKSIGYKWY